MTDDLIATADVAKLLGYTVATINRWAADGTPGKPQPALKLPGETGARLYRRADVEAYKATEDAAAARAGACPTCTPGVHFHGSDGCPPRDGTSPRGDLDKGDAA